MGPPLGSTTRRALATLITAAAVGVPVAVAADRAPLWTFGSAGHGPGVLGPHASGVAVAADGTAYVADASDGRVERFARGGAPSGGWGGLREPAALAFAPDGRLLVADASGVRAFSAAGELLGAVSATTGITGLAVATDGTTILADGARGRLLAVGAGGEHELATLPGVRGVAVTETGDVLASAAERVHRFKADGTHVSSWPAPRARGIAVAPDGSVLVATGTRHAVDVYDAAGSKLASIGEGMNVVEAVAADCRGNVYAIDNSNPRGHAFGDALAPAPPCLPPPAPEPQRVVEPAPAPVVVVPEAVAEPEPVLGVSTRITPLDGAVYVGKARRRLTARGIFPIGTAVDTSEGVAKLEFETAGAADRAKFGRLMSGEFSDGAFTVHQGKGDSLVELVLEQDEKAAAAPASGRAVASAKRRRRVWSTAKGRFRTTGAHGAATVRSTRWLTEERDLGTYFRVREGTIAVKHLATGRTITLGPGEDYLARRPCLSQRVFRIRLRTPVGTTVRSAEVRVRGRRVPVRRGPRLTAVIDLRGVGRQTVAVRIALKLADGRTVTGTRMYRTCRPERLPGGAPPEL